MLYVNSYSYRLIFHNIILFCSVNHKENSLSTESRKIWNTLWQKGGWRTTVGPGCTNIWWRCFWSKNRFAILHYVIFHHPHKVFLKEEQASHCALCYISSSFPLPFAITGSNVILFVKALWLFHSANKRSSGLRSNYWEIME